MSKTLSRRSMLKLGGSAGAVLAASAALIKGASAQAHDSKNISWDAEYDVIVVGSGVAATVAALSALQGGAKTVMLEKMSVPGGSSAISNATIAACGSNIQKAKGIEDSPEAFLEDLATRSQGMNQPEVTETLARNVGAAVNFIQDNGATFEDAIHKFGQNTPRVLQPTTNGAIGIMNPLRTKFLATGGELKTRCVVDEIIFEDGAAVGVKVRNNYHFDERLRSDYHENKGGEVAYYKAKNGIICGTGGFAADKFFRQQEFPHLDSLPTTQQPGATCSGWMLLQNAGARMIHSNLHQFSFPMTAYDMSFGFIVDPTTGKRVFSETLSGPDMSLVISKLLRANGNHLPVALIDADSYEKYIEDKKQFASNTRAGFNGVHDSLEDFAKHYNIPLAPLQETYKNYNQYVVDKKDPEFNKDFAKIDYVAVKKAPFYSMIARPNFSYCLGGALINKDAQVMGANSGKPIPGLYAAGEAASGVFGARRHSGCSIADGCTFGMIAGRNAAKGRA